MNPPVELQHQTAKGYLPITARFIALDVDISAILK
jgi:hypothetical protein